jgi:hypothetical protein
MPDGYQTLVTFASQPAVQLWEMGVKPPGLDGGEPIDTTTMLNQTFRTKDARKLKTLDVMTFKFMYDPDVYPTLLGLINHLDTITVTYPDVSTLAFFGFLQKAEFDDLEEGKPPTGTATIVPTNNDPVTKIEAAPVYTANPNI